MLAVEDEDVRAYVGCLIELLDHRVRKADAAMRHAASDRFRVVRAVDENPFAEAKSVLAELPADVAQRRVRRWNALAGFDERPVGLVPNGILDLRFDLQVPARRVEDPHVIAGDELLAAASRRGRLGDE